MIPTSNSRQAILDRLTSISVDPVEPFSLQRDRLITYDDPVAQFVEVVQSVGAQVQLVDTAQQVRELLQADAGYAAAKHICSLVPEIVAGNFRSEQVDDPHHVAALDWVVAGGEFAVAENGAIWVQPVDAVQRAMLFLTQYLVLVVSRQQMVMQMHDAYGRVHEGWQRNQAVGRFGVFIAGPSKTADIEQSLVIGAHGCRSLQVFLLP